MNVKVRFFAGLKEQLGRDTQVVSEPFSPTTVAGLRQHLCASDPGFAQALAEVGRIQVAVNQDMADEHTEVPNGAEVAFFPPVTGG